MTVIRVLDEATVQKIAAGEVIERPSSIIKELVENSIDAGANSINIEIKNGGKSYIRVTDNGSGISRENLSLAFLPHSTSKLKTVEDLYSINSLGFRGEALASIASVSNMEVISKTSSCKNGTLAKVEAGKVGSLETIGAPLGTTMIVRDLFYNIPVRKKFLKTDLIESNRISDIVLKMALGNRDISFKFIKDNKLHINTNRNQTFENHIYSILGKEFANNMFYIEGEINSIRLSGFISNNKFYRNNRSNQYLYINGRYIEDFKISRAIESIYKTLIPSNRFPSFILFIDLDPEKIDVNIHPSKQEIKFEDENLVISSILEIVESHFSQLHTIPSALDRSSRNRDKLLEEPSIFEFERNKEDSSEPKELEPIEEYIIKDLRANEKTEVKPGNFYKDSGRTNSKNYIYEKEVIDVSESPELIKPEEGLEEIKELLLRLDYVGSIFKTYILGVDNLNEKLYIIDHHAGHERVMYEKYYEEYIKEDITSQLLLSPVDLELSYKEMEIFSDNKHVFESLGFMVDSFGEKTILIREVPLVFGKPNIRNMFYEILDSIGHVSDSNYDLKLDRIMKIACVNSIKSGDNISKEEALELFKKLSRCKRPGTCPHGRPTLISLSKKEIEKDFLRII